MNKTFLDLVQKRKSVRKYRPDTVPRETIERCLEAARLAPSACNSQPWHFIVVDREPVRGKLGQAAFSGIYAMNSFAAQAPVLIVVLTERSKFISALAGRFRGVQYSLIDIGIACAFFALAAEAEGVASCFLGWFDEKAVREVLGLPQNSKIDILMSLGYPAKNGVRNKTRRPPSETWWYAE